MGSGKQWIGAVGAVRVKHEEYNGSTRARVAYCINRRNQEKLPAWNVNNTAPARENSLPFTADDLPF